MLQRDRMKLPLCIHSIISYCPVTCIWRMCLGMTQNCVCYMLPGTHMSFALSSYHGVIPSPDWSICQHVIIADYTIYIYIYIYAPGPATPPLPPHGMGPILRSSPSPPVVWWGCGTVPLPPVVWWGCGMVCWVCMVCMVGLVWHVWKV